MIYIPIGMQCTNMYFLEKHNKRSYTFPFSWMFSTPKFVFEMLELLLDKNINIKELVVFYFFHCTKTATNEDENFIISKDDGYILYNDKYNVIFPHEIDFGQDMNKEKFNNILEKYIRRFQRLKDFILNSEEDICFIYTSQSSLESGNFKVNGINAINDSYYYLTKIYELIAKYKNKFKFIVFDAIKEEDKSKLNTNIILIELNSCNNYRELLPQMDNYVNYL